MHQSVHCPDWAASCLGIPWPLATAAGQAGRAAPRKKSSDRVVQGRTDHAFFLTHNIMTDGPQVMTDGPQVMTDGPQVMTDSPQVMTDGPKVMHHQKADSCWDPVMLVKAGQQGQQGCQLAVGFSAVRQTSIAVPAVLPCNEGRLTFTSIHNTQTSLPGDPAACIARLDFLTSGSIT
jgi:hypothetical protein